MESCPGGHRGCCCINKRFHERACSLCIMKECCADILKRDMHWDGAASAYILSENGRTETQLPG
jgi:hypothetical protein